MSESKSESNTKSRCSQARAEVTRRKIIEAAISCIYDLGYEGTSISSVAKQAGVSKGAAQYHYQSKVDLMLAVAEHCLQLHVDMRYEVYSDFPPGEERISHTAEASWRIINHPSYTALIEIMMATRNNAELKARCQPLIDKIAAARDQGEALFCEEFNVEPNPEVKTLIRTHVTMMRGIAIGMMFHPDRDRFREELDMLQEYERMMRHLIIEKYTKKTSV